MNIHVCLIDLWNLLPTSKRPTCVFENGLTLFLPLVIDSSSCHFSQQLQTLGVWSQCQLVDLARKYTSHHRENLSTLYHHIMYSYLHTHIHTHRHRHTITATQPKMMLRDTNCWTHIRNRSPFLAWRCSRDCFWRSLHSPISSLHHSSYRYT